MTNLMASLPFLKPFDILWKVTSFKEAWKELMKGKVIESEWIFIKDWGLKVKAQMSYDDICDYVSVSLLFIQEDGSDVTRDWLCDLHKRTFVLVDQEKGTDHLIFSQHPEFKATGVQWIKKYEGLYFSSELIKKFKSKFVKDDSILIKVELSPLIPVFLKPVGSYDGTFEWKITEFKKKRQMETKGLRFGYDSESFYFGRRGYRVNGHIFLNCGGNDAKNQFIAVGCEIIRGPFDEELPIDLNKKYTFTIVHPKEPKKNISIEFSGGLREIAKMSHIFSCGYLENDTLTLRIKVEISEISKICN